MPDMPWEDRPAGSKEVMWRYSANPIIPRDALSTSNSIFNSAVVPFRKGKYNYAGVFRCDDTNRRMRIHALSRWTASVGDLRGVRLPAGARIAEIASGSTATILACCEDRRQILRHVVQRLPRPTIGIAWTDDFETFHQLENAFIPINRNGCCSRARSPVRDAVASERHGSHGLRDIFYSESPDMEFWGRHRHVMSPAAFEVSAWQCMKIGAGPVPIETREGWLLLYHGCCARATAMSTRSARRCWTWRSRGRRSPAAVVPDLAARDVRAARATFRTSRSRARALHDPATGRDGRLLRMRRHRHGPCVRLYP